MYEKLKNQILPQLIPPCSRVLVAISGGPDSVALGHILWRYVNEQKSQNLDLVFTHVHHGVRQESDNEEDMVVGLAKEWGVPCLVHHFDSKSYAKLTGQSFQTAAREWRYARWKEDMISAECTLLATAHHLGDQSETVLYRLLRGSGTTGLGGIYPQKENIIRPLLSVKKEDILKYCREEQLPFAIDQSNTEPIYVRNKIRLELLPILERDYNPRIQEALGRLSELLRWDEQYLSQLTEDCWEKYVLNDIEGKIGLKRQIYQEPRAILSRLIRKAVGQILDEPRGIGFSYVGQIIESVGRVGWKQDLPGLSVHIDYQGIWFRKSEDTEELMSVPCITNVKVGEWVFWRDIKGQEWSQGLFESSETFNSEYQLDQELEIIQKVILNRKELEKNNETLVWRTRLPGDRMWLHGLGHKSLKKIFQENKISADERKRFLLLATGDEILWIPGVKVGDRYQIHSEDGLVAIFARVIEPNEQNQKRK